MTLIISDMKALSEWIHAYEAAEKEARESTTSIDELFIDELYASLSYNGQLCLILYYVASGYHTLLVPIPTSGTKVGTNFQTKFSFTRKCKNGYHFFRKMNNFCN